MKKLMTILTAVIMLFSASAFAKTGDTINDNKVSARVKTAFEKDFTKAVDVSWKKTSDFYFAWFTVNDVSVNAAYNENGELVATSREIEVAQLPLSISLALTKNYSGYVMPKLVTELNFEGETNYYVNVANEKQTLKLKFKANGEVTVDKKFKN